MYREGLEFAYINHLGERFFLGGSGCFVNKSNLRDYEYSYDISQGKIKNLAIKEHSPNPTIYLYGENRKRNANIIHEIFEKDTRSGENGIIQLDGYEKKGFCVASEKPEYGNAVIAITLTFVSTERWKKTTHNSFVPVPLYQLGLDYEYDFDYDFAMDIDYTELKNEDFMPCDFILTISGYCDNPSIIVNDHVYNVNVEVQENENLIIDSSNKTILLQRENGEKVNVFYARNREHYIFEKIPSGINRVEYNENMRFSFDLIEERSEPKWI